MSAFALGANALHGAAVAFGRSHANAVKSRVVGSSHRAIRRVALSPVRCAATELDYCDFLTRQTERVLALAEAA